MDKKNEYDSELVNLLFQPEDYLVEKRANRLKNRLLWGADVENFKGTFMFKGFRQTVAVCRKRLEIFGTGMASVKEGFGVVRKRAGQNYYDPDYDFPITKLSFSSYYKELKDILISLDYSCNHLFDRGSLRRCLINDGLYIAGQRLQDSLYAIFSVLGDDEIVEYDLSDVIEGGWVTKEVAAEIKHDRIIILTEGKTDADFLDKSMQLLYPFLRPYYHFMDFDGYKVEGNVSALVKTVKSFAAANVRHPVIALFDNDTAGRAEMINLPQKLPANIKTLRLPDIKMAKKYPTNGPGGVKVMNVNGFACGIEMYLGAPLLAVGGQLARVRWVGYNEKLREYQGALEYKSEIQKVFLKKIKSGDISNMPEMHQLLNMLFAAFL